MHVYLLDRNVSTVYFVARMQIDADFQVFRLCVQKSTHQPSSVVLTSIPWESLTVHDPSQTLFVWSRAIIFKGHVYGERWEYACVSVASDLCGVVVEHVQLRSKQRTHGLADQ